MTTVATDLDAAVADAAAHLYVWALKDIPQDLREALARAAGTETSVTGLAARCAIPSDSSTRAASSRSERPRTENTPRWAVRPISTKSRTVKAKYAECPCGT